MILPGNVLSNRYAIHQYVTKYREGSGLYAVDGEKVLFREGQRQIPAGEYKFRLECNPTMRESRSRKRRMVDSPIDWLNRQGDKFGFRVLSADVRVRRVTFRRHGVPGALGIADFTGRLLVEDPERFSTAYLQGLGSAKCFGFGMIRLEGI